jgi:uncharacterized protein
MTSAGSGAMIGPPTVTDTIATDPTSGRPPLAGRFLLLAIRMYRLLLSPLLGPSCRYIPTCSHYAEDAIRTWGPWRGGALAAWRIARCHPFCTGGIDLVPARGPRKTETLPLG